MGINRSSALAALAALAACGSGGGTGGNNAGTGNASYGGIALIGHEPTDGQLQVAADVAITLQFDRPVLRASLDDADTWLRRSDSSTNVAGAFFLQDSGTTVSFTPQVPLTQETDYVFQLSALTCDADGHLLDTQVQFRFRTLDTNGPTVQSSDITPGQTNRSRTAPLRLWMSESLDLDSLTRATVMLRDGFGQDYTCRRSLDGSALTLTPLAELPGDRAFTLQLTQGVCDRAGNALAQPWSIAFRTAPDTTAPTVTGAWPAMAATGISPYVQPVFEFSESMDPYTVEPASVLFQDEFGGRVPFAVVASDDQRTLRLSPLQPLQSQRTYSLAFLLGGAGVTDVSGNPLASTRGLSFRTGTDVAAPGVSSASPQGNETRVSLNAQPTVTFDEALDADWVDDTTVALWRQGERVPAVVTLVGGNRVQVAPVLLLDPDRSYQLVLTGGHQGLRDRAGNVLPDDLVFPFATAADASLPSALLLPGDGATGVPSTIHASVVFDAPLDPASVSEATCELRTDQGIAVPGSVALDASGRVIAITPYSALMPGAYYRTFVRGGPAGVRERSGNWLGADLRARFRIGNAIDHSAPSVNVTVNAIDQSRRQGLVVPPAGFTIDVTAADAEQSLDMGSARILWTGAGSPPTPGDLFAAATIGYNSLRVLLPAKSALAAGAWTLRVEVADLSGNVGSSASLDLQVSETSAALLPFETTQVVWVRTDLDRDGNGRTDFDDDLIRLGLATAADPIGVNARTRQLLLDAILARASSLYGRGADGEPLGPDSVPVRLTTRPPFAVKHMEIALGGLDPEGSGARGYGSQSTGVLGRAYYDHRNANMNDRNLATSPGLGVFPGEMWLYQTDLHRQLYPSFTTMFAQRFLPLCPPMGGVPAGLHADDATVLAPGFDVTTANSNQRARWSVLMHAIDDWALVNGTVLAHEIGHGVGLVAPGPAPGGLFGDASLHNTNAGATEVMAPSVGYEAMVTMSYAFRDVDLAYLRQRLIVR